MDEFRVWYCNFEDIELVDIYECSWRIGGLSRFNDLCFCQRIVLKLGSCDYIWVCLGESQRIKDGWMRGSHGGVQTKLEVEEEKG